MAQRKKVPTAEQPEKELPEVEQAQKKIPDAVQADKDIPDAAVRVREMPKVGKPENTIVIGGKLIEIKATKLKYQRNRTATFYHMLDLYPLSDILSMEEGQFGDDRDGDKALMDWLIAVTDDEELILQNYDEMTTEDVEKLLEIYKRVNKHVQKEANLKNLERTQKAE